MAERRTGFMTGCIVGVGLLLVVIVGGVFAYFKLVLPKQEAVLVHAKELATVAKIQSINRSQLQYQAQFGHFATALSQLGPPPPGTQEGPDAAGLLAERVAGGSADGYLLRIIAKPDGYAVTAVPEDFGVTGRRTFYSDESGVIRQNRGPDAATAESPAVR
jgi:type IV pilus assembly protein PilA